MKNKEFVRNLLALATSAVIISGSLTGCGPNNNESSSVKKGTTYEYKYKDSDSQYVKGTIGGSIDVNGLTGKIKLLSDSTATLTNVCYQGWLYRSGKGTCKVVNEGIELHLYKSLDATCYSTIIGPLPKTDKSITVPIDMYMNVNVTYSKIK